MACQVSHHSFFLVSILIATTMIVRLQASAAAVMETQTLPEAHICMITSFRERPYIQETSEALLRQINTFSMQSNVSLSIMVASSSNISEEAPVGNNNSNNNIILQSPLAQLMRNREVAVGADCLLDSNNTNTNNTHNVNKVVEVVVLDTDSSQLPSCKVRQQGLDVANALESCHSDSNPSVKWIILLEDDFLPCENALPQLLSTLSTIDSNQNKFARFTQGGGGVAFPRANVPLYVQSVRDNISRKPCDQVLLEGWSTKPDMVFPHHLFRHIGEISTIESRNTEAYRQRFAAIRDNACGSPITV